MASDPSTHHVRVHVRSIDPRDQTWEQNHPAYRVYFHDADGLSDEYEVTGADVEDVIAWAHTQLGKRTFVLYVAVAEPDGLGLVRLLGHDPHANQAPSASASVAFTFSRAITKGTWTSDPDVVERLQRRPGPAPAPEVVDAELGAWREGVVVPVVDGLLLPEELESVQLLRGAGTRRGDVWVEVVAQGEVFCGQLFDPAWSWEGWAVQGEGQQAAVAARLADQLEDWVCETAFAWGQQRRAKYVLPGL